MRPNFQKILIAGLVCGCLFHPASSAVGLLFILAGEAAERYFTRNISDKDRQALGQLKAEVEKVAAVQQKDGLAKAFGGRT